MFFYLNKIHFCHLNIMFSVTRRNHSWVSFQGYAESYNDAFNVPVDKGAGLHKYFLIHY